MRAASFGFVNKNSFRSFFGQKSFSKVLILLFSTKKMVFKVLTLERRRNRYTRSFSTILVLINFYYFRRIQTKYNQYNWRHLYFLFLTISMLITFLFFPISVNTTFTPKIWPKIIFFAKLIKFLLGFEEKRLKSVQERSLSKIVYIFIIFITKSQFRFWPLPL